MSGKFEWHTLDKRDWEQMDTADQTTGVPVHARWTSRLLSRRFAAILSVLLLLIVFGSRQILLQAQETNEQIRADVLAANAFMLQAALNRDPERLDLVLSETDMQWRHLQRVTMRRSLLFDRGPFNLWLDEKELQQRLEGNELSSELVLSPDLTTAEVTMTLPYLTQNPYGTIERVSMRHISHFAYDGIQWRQVPSSADYWGPTESYNGQLITLDYPARDAEISRYLAAAFDDFYLSLCRLELAVPCASNPYVHITFAVDTEAFIPLSRPVQGNRFWIFGERMAAGDVFDVSLPTPTLVGLPDSLEDRQVLLNGYAGWLLTSYLSRKHPELSFEHIDRLMEDLNLQLPPPVGYNPALSGTALLLPADRALLSCYEDDHVREQYTYDFRKDEWASLSVDYRSCANCGPNELSMTDLVSADDRFMLSNAADSEHLIMSQQILLSALPEKRTIKTLRIDTVLVPEPANSDLLVLAGNGIHEQFLFRVDLVGGEAELVANWVDNGSNFHSVEMTEDGRFLTVIRHNTRRTYLTLIDLNTGQKEIMELTGRPLSRYTWSADEQWLLVANDRLLRLISPANNINVTFKHTFEGCTAVSWLN